MPESPDEKRMRLRYSGTCDICEAALTAGTEAIYQRTTRTIRCVTCSRDGSDAGIPGASARREFERRRTTREADLRSRHPRIGGFLHAVTNDPQSTTAWDLGAIGEEQLGAKLNSLTSRGFRVMHDRRIPGSRANIDHLAVTPNGIYVIDAKRYIDQRPTLRVEGGLIRPRVEKLLVGSRDRTKLVDGMLKQVGIVQALLGEGVPVTGVLCFIGADWPLIAGAFRTRGVLVLRPKKLYPLLSTPGAHADRIDAHFATLAQALPPA